MSRDEYHQLVNGQWMKDDGTGPYIQTEPDVFELLAPSAERTAGVVETLLPASTTGNVIGPWVRRSHLHSAVQHTVTGTGVGGCTVTTQVSNDGVTPLAIDGGISAFSFNSNTVSDGFEFDAPWQYIRAVVTGASGSITSIESTMSA